MINIFFVPGMFGTSMEFCIRTFSTKFSNALPDISNALTDDGSMHTFRKKSHFITLAQAVDSTTDADITTPIYPMVDAKFRKIFETVTNQRHGSKNIIIGAESMLGAELNLLFVFYKVAHGVSNKGLDVFTNNNTTDFSQWGANYSHWSHLKRWEFREWFSIYYPSWITDWIAPTTDPSDSALILYNTDILSDFEGSVKKVLRHCELSLCNQKQLRALSIDWLAAQNYILNEFNSISAFVSNAINGVEALWPTACPMNIITESIIQTRLLQRGYNLQCYDLELLPKNSKTLHQLLTKI